MSEKSNLFPTLKYKFCKRNLPALLELEENPKKTLQNARKKIKLKLNVIRISFNPGYSLYVYYA